MAEKDIRIPFGADAATQSPLTTQNVGTVPTGVTVVEHGDGIHHKTVLTLGTGCIWPDIPGGADLAVGVAIYTLPAGVINIRSTYMSVGVTALDGNIDADVPDVGIGTTIATGVVTVLGGTAAFENILTGVAADNCTGTAELSQVQTALVIASADSHIVYFNGADGWAASGENAAAIAGTVIIEWDFQV